MTVRRVTIAEEPTTEMIERMAKGIELANNNSAGVKFSELLRMMACMAYMELFKAVADGERATDD